MKQLNLWTAALLLGSLAFPMNLSAQKVSKVSQSIKVDAAVTVKLNTNYCTIELDTWNKDIVEVEAYIDGEKLSQEALQEALERWHIDVDATSSEVVISTSGASNYNWNFAYRYEDNDAVIAAIDELKFTLADLPELAAIPEFPKFPEMELPPLPEGINQIRFDYEAYKKDSEKYMKKWNEEFEKKFGKNYEKEMEAWAEKFEKEWGERFGEHMEQWGERYGKQMEAWGKRYEAQLAQREEMQAEHAKIQEERAKHREEAQAQREEANAMRQEQRAKAAELRKAGVKSMLESGSNPKVKRVIKLKVPKKAKLQLNVKHGELKLASNVNNLEANLVYTKLMANSITGSATSINVSYAPVVVDNWDLGRLNLNYVEEARLAKVNHLVLSSKSSHVFIDQVNSNAIIDGSFGALKILNVAPGFSGMNLVLQNSEMVLVLPQTAFNLQFKGRQTFLKHPKNTNRELVEQFSMGDLTNSKAIIVNAKFSDVKLQ